MDAKNRMSRAVEVRLKSAVEFLSDLVDNEEATPDSALKSAADKYNLLPEQVRVVGRAFNTGRTVAGYEGSDLKQKTATDQLADVEAVVSELFPDREKAAADNSARFRQSPRPQLELHSDYNMPPQAVYATHTPLRKTASTTVEEYEARLKSAYMPRPDQLWTRLRGKLQQEVQAAQEKFAALAFDFNEKYAALAQRLRREDTPALAEIQNNYTLVKGAGASELFDSLKQSFPGYEKRAADRHFVSWDRGSIYNQIHDVHQTYLAMKQAEEESVACHKYAIDSLSQVLEPYVERDLSVSLDRVDEVRREKAAALLGGPLMVGAGMEMGKSFPKAKSPEGLIKSKVDKIGAPGHEQELSAIKTRSMLDGLMNTDPILKGYERDEIVRAFNDISSIAPQAVRNPAYAKALLRKYLEQGGALDPFDMNQLIQSEKSIVDRNIKLMDNLRKEEAVAPPAR